MVWQVTGLSVFKGINKKRECGVGEVLLTGE